MISRRKPDGSMSMAAALAPVKTPKAAVSRASSLDAFTTVASLSRAWRKPNSNNTAIAAPAVSAASVWSTP